MTTTTPHAPRLPGFKRCAKSGKFVTRRPITEQQLITAARRALHARFAPGACMANPSLVGDYLLLLLADRPREVFACLYLDAQRRVIRCEELFQGTVDATGVYPREVVKQALALNAASVIFAHNHPSGFPQPSGADRRLTLHLQQALSLVGIRVLDHFVVGNGSTFSFVENGLLEVAA